MNDKNEILTIQERYTLLNKSRWKLPGGLVDPSTYVRISVLCPFNR